MPSGERASTRALPTAGSAPTLPASPAPLTPSGLVLVGTGLFSQWIAERSPAPGLISGGGCGGVSEWGQFAPFGGGRSGRAAEKSRRENWPPPAAAPSGWAATAAALVPFSSVGR